MAELTPRQQQLLAAFDDLTPERQELLLRLARELSAPAPQASAEAAPAPQDEAPAGADEAAPAENAAPAPQPAAKKGGIGGLLHKVSAYDWDEAAVLRRTEQLKTEYGVSYNARRTAIDEWRMHTGAYQAPKGWKDPYK